MNRTVELLKKALIRALYTIAEVAISMITIGAAVTEIDWLHILSVSVVSGIVSFLKSIVVGVPELDVEIPAGQLTVDMTDPDDPVVEIDIGDNEIDDILKKKSIKIDVIDGKL